MADLKLSGTSIADILVLTKLGAVSGPPFIPSFLQQSLACTKIDTCLIPNFPDVSSPYLHQLTHEHFKGGGTFGIPPC